MIYSLVWGTIFDNISNDPPYHCILDDRITKDENRKVAMCAQFLETSPQVSPYQGGSARE